MKKKYIKSKIYIRHSQPDIHSHIEVPQSYHINTQNQRNSEKRSIPNSAPSLLKTKYQRVRKEIMKKPISRKIIHDAIKMTNIRLAKWNNEGREMKTIPSTAVTRNCKTKSEKSWDWSKRTQAFRSHIHLRNQNNISQPLENNFKRRK